MRAPDRIAVLARDDHGAVLVIFALLAPVMVVLAAFAIDTSNWFLHKRHLQVQADAAVFAAAKEFQPCVDESVYERAAEYGGDATVTTPAGTKTFTFANPEEPFNQLQGRGHPESGVHVLINRKQYYGQSSPVDETPGVDKPPCEASMVDAKVTETNLHWYWRIFSVPYINAHARIEILHQVTATGLSPLAVAESAPVAAKAYFVDEDNKDAILAEAPLVNLGKNKEGQDVWSNATVPVSVAVSKPHMGVVIALSGDKSDTKCGDALVRCYDMSATGPSLMHIQGWSAAGAGTGSYKAPIARKVTLQPGTCSDPYFAAGGVGCSIGVTAGLDLGATPNPPGVTVSAVVGGGTAAPMTYSSEKKTWATTGLAALGKAGANQVDIRVTCNPKTAGSPCPAEKKSVTATVTNVQRAYAASEASSGPIKGAWISEPSASETPVPRAFDADSYEVCEAADGNKCSHSLVVTADVAGSLADAQSVADPVYRIRDEGPNKTKVSCPPGVHSAHEYEESLVHGCPGTYKINTSDPKCTAKGSPIDCVALFNGVSRGPFDKGVEERITNHPGTHYYCANNWSKFPNLPADDSRVIQVFIVPYAAAEEGGEVPIQDFAAFYVTGYDSDPCKEPGEEHPGKNEIVGHFIKYVNTIGEGNPEEKCSQDPLGECVAVLTR
jgi:hypothetical protein